MVFTETTATVYALHQFPLQATVTQDMLPPTMSQKTPREGQFPYILEDFYTAPYIEPPT